MSKRLDAYQLGVIKQCPACSAKPIKSCSDIAIAGVCAKCSQRLVTTNMYCDAGIPLDFWDLGMAAFPGPPELMTFYRSVALDLSQTYLAGATYCISGTHGVGKSSTIANVLKRALRSGFTASYMTLGDAVDAMTNSDTSYDCRQQLINADFIALDEFDSRYVSTESSSNLWGRTLESIVRARMQAHTPTFLVSNSPNPLAMFTGALAASLTSLWRKVQTVTVLGPDLR